MATVNYDNRVIILNLVLFGAPECGKKSWLVAMQRALTKNVQLMEESLRHEKSLSFRWDPSGGDKVDGFTNVFDVRTCALDLDIEPAVHSKIIEQADGIIFIADSNTGKSESNIRYLKELQKQVSANGAELVAGKLECEPIEKDTKSGIKDLKTQKISWMIGLNKRDLQNCIELKQMQDELAIDDAEMHETCGREGLGIFEIFKRMHSAMVNGIHQKPTIAELFSEKNASRND